VLTVNADQALVERQLGDGELACPSCEGVLAGWGKGVARRVRLPGGPDRLGRFRHAELVPRRSRCRGCGATHVLLPADPPTGMRIVVAGRPDLGQTRPLSPATQDDDVGTGPRQ
jgi:hypothetical protein